MRKTLAILLSVAIIGIVAGICISESGSDAESQNRISVSCDHGRLIDQSTGTDYAGGTFSGELNLKFIPNNGYEFRSWEIAGTAVYITDGNGLTVKSIGTDVKINVTIRNYSTSQELINTVDVNGLAQPGDDLVLAWSFTSGLTSAGSGMQWSAMPCTPLIVGDRVYIRVGERLYELDINNGTVLHAVQSDDVKAGAYYHYLSYGNGVIFDTIGHKAYDLDLNYLYDIPSNLAFATYHDGYFYGCLRIGEYYIMYKTSPEVNRDLDGKVKTNLFHDRTPHGIWAQYGQFTNVTFVGDWFFFLDADHHTGKNGYRAICAYNVVTEKYVDKKLTGFEGMPWDDGWLTYYDGYFYLTAYTAGLFDGIIKGLEEKRSSLMWVKFDFEKGSFEEPSYKNIQTPEGKTFRGIASGLVIYEGRGYLNVRSLGTSTVTAGDKEGTDDRDSKMIAYDIGKNGEPIPKGAADTVMTHGGIVVNTARVKEGKIHIYLLPYNSSDQAVFVFTDEKVNGEWKLRETPDKLKTVRMKYCSQCIRAGPDGEMVYYVDSGYIDCYVPAKKYWNVITVNDGNITKSETGYGKNTKEIIEKMFPSAKVTGGRVTIGDKVYAMYGKNGITDELVPLTNPSSGAYTGLCKNGISETHYRYIYLFGLSPTDVPHRPVKPDLIGSPTVDGFSPNDEPKVFADRVLTAERFAIFSRIGGVPVIITYDQSFVFLTPHALKKIDGSKGLTLTITDKAVLNHKQELSVGNAKVFCVELKNGDVPQHGFGRFIVSLACDIRIQDGKELKVWKVGKNGERGYATDVEYKDGKVTFVTDDPSVYAVGYDAFKPVPKPVPDRNGSGNSIDTIPYLAAGIVAVLVIAGIAAILRRKF